MPAPAVPVATAWRPGLVAGAVLHVPLSHRLALRQEYLYAQLGGEVMSTGTRYRMHYLSLPLLLSYAPTPWLALLAGPQFDLLLKAEQEQGGQRTTITHDTEERGLGAIGGVEVRLSPHLGVSARYLLGLNHVGIGQRSAVQEFKYEAVQLAAEVKF